MQGPNNNKLPFLTYGIFKPGELSYLSIRSYVENIKPIEIKGSLFLRDGIVFFNDNGSKMVKGFLLEFKDEQSASKAYETINNLEPDKLFLWSESKINGETYNILVGKRKDRGSESIEELHHLKNINDYSLWNEDPYFTKGLQILEDFAKSKNDLKFDSDFSSSFKIQMHYLFLWIIIERFTTFRYGFGNPESRINKLSENEYFIKALEEKVKEERIVFDAGKLDKFTLSSKNPKGSIKYYRQVRNNLTHRGKGISKDFDIISKSFDELLFITEYLIGKSKNESNEELKRLTK